MVVIPHELLRPIVSSVSDRKTLFALLFCSRWLQEEAERCLYSTFSSRYQDDWNHLSWRVLSFSQHQGFFQRVADHPRIASYVKRINLELDGDHDPYSPSLENFFATLNRAFALVSNLEVLGKQPKSLPQYFRS